MSENLRELILWRHAKSDWSDPNLDDHDRPLAERGRRNAKKMANWIEKQGLKPDFILCSSAKRTQQTLKRLCPDCQTPTQITRSIYHVEFSELLSELAQIPHHHNRVLMIGHNPGLESLIDFLVGHHSPRSPEVKLFPTAAIAHFIMPTDWSNLQKGAGRLVSITRPKDL